MFCVGVAHPPKLKIEAIGSVGCRLPVSLCGGASPTPRVHRAIGTGFSISHVDGPTDLV